MTGTCDYCGWAPATTTGDLPHWGVRPLCDHCYNLMGYTTPHTDDDDSIIDGIVID
jgi:hypothetical protein